VRTRPAVVVSGVAKRYRLYGERNQSLKSAVLRRGRARYDEFWAVRDVSLEVPAGSTYGLVGENGSGKSTLLKCMARILRPDCGTISIDGKVSALLELAAGFHPELSGRDNVFLNGSILGLSRRELSARFDEIVDFAGIEDFIDEPVKNYSSGMYVRLGFSVAINVDPDVLLVDEVLAVGDEGFQRKCAEKFGELKSAGKTVVLVSHSLGTVRNLCDEVAWLDHGLVRASGQPGVVVDRYIEATQPDREVHEEGGSRWGSGEGRVEHIELLDSAGRPTTRVRTGDRVTFRLHYDVSVSIPQPVFGLAVTRVDGVLVTGPNTRDADMVPAQISGQGFVDLAVERLALLPGSYDVDASLYDFTCLHPFDFRHHGLRFDVEAGAPRESYGLVTLGGSWRIEPLQRPTAIRAPVERTA